MALLATACVQAADLCRLPIFLKQTSNIIWPGLKDISVAIYHDPEVGLDEHQAHHRVVRHFHGLDDRMTKPRAFNMETAFEMSFEHIPTGYSGPVNTIGFLAEYDALVGVGHACGHNHIFLNGMAAAILTSRALQHFDIPGRIKLVGCPDEENAAGKYALNQRGAFNSSDIWLMAHPTSKSAVQPMNARLNLFATFLGETHEEVVGKAYQAMATVSHLGKLPGTASSIAAIENVGVYATNVVQSFISLVVSGMSLQEVNGTVRSILDKTYPGVDYKIFEDKDGVALNITGPGGHGSEASRGPLTLSIEVFRAVSSRSGVSFYLPGNGTATELDVTVDLRSRYTDDLLALATFVSDSIAHISDSMSHDIKCPALEVVPYIPETFLSIIGSDDYGLTDWNVADFAPASTDASWLENPTLDPTTRRLLGVDRVVLHANYSICGWGTGDPCAFSHEPAVATVAGTEFSYAQTESVARGQAHMAVELLADAVKWSEATAIIRRT